MEVVSFIAMLCIAAHEVGLKGNAGKKTISAKLREVYGYDIKDPRQCIIHHCSLRGYSLKPLSAGQLAFKEGRKLARTSPVITEPAVAWEVYSDPDSPPWAVTQ